MSSSKENPPFSISKPMGALQLSGLGATTTRLFAITTFFLFAAPLYFLTAHFTPLTSVRWPSVLANILVFLFASSFVRMAVDKETGKPLARMREDFALDISLLVSSLTTGLALLEIARGWTRPLEASVRFNAITDDLCFGSMAFALGLITYHLVFEERKHIQGKLSTILTVLCFAASSLLYIHYTMHLTGFYEEPWIDPTNPTISFFIRSFFFYFCLLIAVLAGSESIMKARVLDHLRVFGIPTEENRKKLVAILSLWVAFAVSCFVVASSMDTTLPGKSVNAILCTVTPDDDHCRVAEAPSLRDRIILAPDYSQRFLLWAGTPFVKKKSYLKGEQEGSGFETPSHALKEICARKILIVGAGASASGTREENIEYSEARTKALGKHFQKTLKRPETPCNDRSIRIFAVSLGYYNDPKDKSDIPDQRMPIVLAGDFDLPTGEAEIKVLGELVSEEIVRAVETDRIPNICHQYYEGSNIYEFEGADKPVSLKASLKFRKAKVCEQ